MRSTLCANTMVLWHEHTTQTTSYKPKRGMSTCCWKKDDYSVTGFKYNALLCPIPFMDLRPARWAKDLSFSKKNVPIYLASIGNLLTQNSRILFFKTPDKTY